MSRAHAGAAFAVMAAITSIAGVGRAQGTGQDVATAQALFDEGKRLMAAKDFANACPKLVESQRLDPGGGTLYAIALCHEAEGKTATAWADYGVAQSEARKDGRKDREQAAAEKARTLEPKLTKMRIVVAEKTAGLELTRDGGKVGDAQWGLALPIDPGSHVFAAKAPGRVDWTSTVKIEGEGKTVDVAIPALAEAPKAPEPVTAPVPVTTSPPPPPPPPESHGLNPQKTWAVVVGAAGVIGLGVGAGFGISAISKWNDAEKACPKKVCTKQSDTDLESSAGTAADLSTVLVSVGAGALIAGVVLWITAPSSAPKSAASALWLTPTASRDGAGFALGGKLW